MRALIAGLATAVLLAGCGSDHGGGDGHGDASCAATLRYAGHMYHGHGELKRDPPTTGRIAQGTSAGCDDGNGREPGRSVDVAELAGVPLRRAALVEGTLYVRSDLPLPVSARKWLVAPRCRSAGPIDLAGQWLSVNPARRPRFDGDLRAPYRVGIHVARGPGRYVGSTIKIQVTEHTGPSLGPHDVRTSLWEGGDLSAKVHCVDGRFVATRISSTPG